MVEGVSTVSNDLLPMEVPGHLQSLPMEVPGHSQSLPMEVPGHSQSLPMEVPGHSQSNFYSTHCDYANKICAQHASHIFIGLKLLY